MENVDECVTHVNLLYPTVQYVNVLYMYLEVPDIIET